MIIDVVFAATLLAQSPPAPNVSAITSHMRMELDDLDYEIRRQQAALEVARQHFQSTQRAYQRGVATRNELEQVSADVRSLEARAGEAEAFRALKEYEQGVLNRTIQPDEEKAVGLVLALLKKQETMAQVELDFQTYRLKQQDTLLSRGAITRQEHANAELDFDTARLHVALAQARQAQVGYEHAARPGREKVPEAAELTRLKNAYLEGRVRYYEIGLMIANGRLEMAKDQLRRGMLTQNDVDAYQKVANDLQVTVKTERARLEQKDEPAPASLPRAS